MEAILVFVGIVFAIPASIMLIEVSQRWTAVLLDWAISHVEKLSPPAARAIQAMGWPAVFAAGPVVGYAVVLGVGIAAALAAIGALSLLALAVVGAVAQLQKLRVLATQARAWREMRDAEPVVVEVVAEPARVIAPPRLPLQPSSIH
jgi:hypothetical protein